MFLFSTQCMCSVHAHHYYKTTHSRTGTLHFSGTCNERTPIRAHMMIDTSKQYTSLQEILWWWKPLFRGHLSSGDTSLQGHLSSGDTSLRGYSDEGHLSSGDTSLQGHLSSGYTLTMNTSLREILWRGTPLFRGYSDKGTPLFRGHTG